MIREYYPRIEGEKVSYPPPITPEGGDFQYEFPAGAATPDGGGDLDNQMPPYSPGPPHWCTVDMYESGHWDGVCPYVFKGPDAGKYRHPHVAFAALEVYLANQAMPNKCATTWLENNPDFLDADRVASDTPFPEMDADDQGITTLAHWIGQPVLPWNYVSDPVRAHPGPASTKIYFSEVSCPAVITAEFGFSQIEACEGDRVKVVWLGWHNIQETNTSDCNSDDIGEQISEYHAGGYEKSFNNNEMSAAPGKTRYFKCSLHCGANANRIEVSCQA